MSEWYRVVLPYAVYALELRDGVVVETASIARWMRGKTLSYVSSWVQRKGGQIALLQ